MGGALRALFAPRSVALVGASSNPAKLGNVVLRNLLRGKFELYPVNPHEDEILGRKCYRSVSDLPLGIDLALIALPAETAGEARLCVQRRESCGCHIFGVRRDRPEGHGDGERIGRGDCRIRNQNVGPEHDGSPRTFAEIGLIIHPSREKSSSSERTCRHRISEWSCGSLLPREGSPGRRWRVLFRWTRKQDGYRGVRNT